MLVDKMDPKRLVADGYNRIADRYTQWMEHVRDDEREHYTSLLLQEVAPGACVLELGCGAGIPTTRGLAARFKVTGVDISARHIALAQQHVPEADFVCADMTALSFPPASFAAVAAFYSIIHVPRQEHGLLLKQIAPWLQPEGLLVATMGARDDPGSFEPDWLGAPMYWSHYDSATNKQLVAQAGLEILSAREETAEEDGEPVTFLWIVARKPTAG